jgi:hypothetical protein
MLIQVVSAAMGAGFAIAMWTMYQQARDAIR